MSSPSKSPTNLPLSSPPVSPCKTPRMPPPEIPMRKSSKKRTAEHSLDKDRTKLRRLIEDISKARKDLKPQGSLDSTYWEKRAKVAEQECKMITLHRRVSIGEFQKDTGGTRSEWLQTKEAEEFNAKDVASTMRAQVCRKQSLRLKIEPGGEGKSRRRAFLQFWTTSTMGLRISTGAGTRDAKLQSAFRQELQALSETKPPQFTRCPITKQWHDTQDLVAAHLFPYRSGQAAMISIFGKDAENELFSPKNGMLITKRAEELLDAGLLLIVPDLPADPTMAQLALWASTDQKDYRVKVPNPSHPLVHMQLSVAVTQTYADLDGSKVEFHGSSRPRARYLYFLYVSGVLRYTWAANTKGKFAHALDGEIGRPYWGTVGPFLRQSLIRGFVEEIGHEFEPLLGSGLEDPETGETSKGAAEEDPALLALTCDRIFGNPVKSDELAIQQEKDEEAEEEEEEDGHNDL
ncbi:MAG: hypothetical protein Q9173_002174 [Seirophora scorigena]